MAEGEDATPTKLEPRSFGAAVRPYAGEVFQPTVADGEHPIPGQWEPSLIDRLSGHVPHEGSSPSLPPSADQYRPRGLQTEDGRDSDQSAPNHSRVERRDGAARGYPASATFSVGAASPRQADREHQPAGDGWRAALSPDLGLLTVPLVRGHSDAVSEPYLSDGSAPEGIGDSAAVLSGRTLRPEVVPTVGATESPVVGPSMKGQRLIDQEPQADAVAPAIPREGRSIPLRDKAQTTVTEIQSEPVAGARLAFFADTVSPAGAGSDRLGAAQVDSTLQRVVSGPSAPLVPHSDNNEGGPDFVRSGFAPAAAETGINADEPGLSEAPSAAALRAPINGAAGPVASPTVTRRDLPPATFKARSSDRVESPVAVPSGLMDSASLATEIRVDAPDGTDVEVGTPINLPRDAGRSPLTVPSPEARRLAADVGAGGRSFPAVPPGPTSGGGDSQDDPELFTRAEATMPSIQSRSTLDTLDGGTSSSAVLGVLSGDLSRPGAMADPSRGQMPLPAEAAVAAANIRQIVGALAGASGPDRIELRLDPPELGRVSIDLAMGNDRVTATVSAERPETLEFLRRHADLLHRELGASGFGSTDVAFGDRRGAGQGSGSLSNAEPEPSPSQTAVRQPAALARSAPTVAGRLDIRL